MSPSRKLVAALMGLTLLGAPALGDEPYVYPTQGQSADQMDRDKYDCYTWAKQQTGYDPANPPPPPSGSGGTTTSAGEGAAKGAAIGLVVGGLRRGPRRTPVRGAVTGAVIGGLVGGVDADRTGDSRLRVAEVAIDSAAVLLRGECVGTLHRSLSLCDQGLDLSLQSREPLRGDVVGMRALRSLGQLVAGIALVVLFHESSTHP